jgi:hypothetical protein
MKPMSQQTIQDEIDRENKRQSRIATQNEGLTHSQRERLNPAKHAAEVALARAYSGRLNEGISKRIVEGLVLQPEVLCTISGGVNELPITQQGWDSFVRGLADAEPLAQMSIDSADADLKRDIGEEALDAMQPKVKMHMARMGTLDDHIAGIIKAKLTERFDQ